MPDKKPSSSHVVVVAHDGGGGEIVSSWVRRHPENTYSVFALGPSEGIFAAKNIDYQAETDLDHIRETILRADWVLAGTGSHYEKSVIDIAREENVRVVAFLDHWTKYRTRFAFEGPSVLPDEIWVGDEHALKIARSKFPVDLVTQVPNPYFEDLKDEITAHDKAVDQARAGIRILYLAQSIGNHPQDHRLSGQREEYAMEYRVIDRFLNSVENYVKSIGSQLAAVCVRRHPSEAPGKYISTFAKYPNLEIAESNNPSLAVDCAWADWVVGYESTALVAALIADRKVFTLSDEANRSSTPLLAQVPQWPPFAEPLGRAKSR